MLVLIACGAGSVPVQAASLQAASDLQAEAQQANARGMPLVILFSRSDCRYCETVRRDYLLPLLEERRYRQRIIVRQINQDQAQSLRGFRGEASSHASFAQQQKIRLVPVLAFFAADGQQLAPAIVGAKLADFYPAYLERAIEQSVEALAAQQAR